jgi:MFS family permease
MNSPNAITESIHSIRSALQLSNQQIWLQAIGRSLSQVASGLIYFYIPLVFVNQIGLSATSVGFSVGLSSLTGVVGHILGGVLVDSPRFGRKRTLIGSAGLGAVVSLILVATSQLPLLIVANLLLGLSVGFYWTAADAAVMDVTQPEERPQAFAIMSTAENVGNGVGILGGGALLLLLSHTPQLLFASCGAIFLLFLLMVQFTMSETHPAASPPETHSSPANPHSTQGLLVALQDRSLLIFILANVLFTTYIALVTTTIPLYFTRFIPAIAGEASTAAASTANLFTWCYIGLGALLQLPVAQLLRSLPPVRVLMLALGLWVVGFGLLWVTGIATIAQATWGVSALCLMAIATIMYKPFAAAIVAELAPSSLRGAYLALSSQCWAIGYFFGPTFGGWAMDQAETTAHLFWLIVAASSIVGFLLLGVFERVRTLTLNDTSTANTLN